MKRFYLLLFTILVLFTSCHKEEEISSQNEMVLKNDSISEIELGNKLSNPYTIDNMLAAYQNLTVKGIHSKVEPNIRITHYYIKISPNSMDEYTLLKENNQLNLYDFPLDYEVLSEGNKYHDKSLADSIPTYQVYNFKS